MGGSSGSLPYLMFSFWSEHSILERNTHTEKEKRDV